MAAATGSLAAVTAVRAVHLAVEDLAAASGTATATPKAAKAAETTRLSCLGKQQPRRAATLARAARRSVTQRAPRKSVLSSSSYRRAACLLKSWLANWP